MKVPTQQSLVRSKGFSLIEILITVSIIVVLMGLTFGIGKVALQNAAVNKTKTQVALFEAKIQEYEADFGEFPPGDGSERSSRALYDTLYQIGIQTNRKVYMPELDPDQSAQFSKIEQGIIFDPFKVKPYYYLRGTDENGETTGNAFNPDFDLWSLGPNKVGRGSGGSTEEDTEDDITNW